MVLGVFPIKPPRSYSEGPAYSGKLWWSCSRSSRADSGSWEVHSKFDEALLSARGALESMVGCEGCGERLRGAGMDPERQVQQ